MADDEVYAVVDIETTGGSRQNDAITEIGAVLCWRGEILSEFSTLVNPRRPIPWRNTQLTGITDVMVVDAPDLDVVLEDFDEWAEESVFVAHNVPFDLQFLQLGYQRHGMNWRMGGPLDTVTLAKKMLPLKSYKLRELARHFEVPLPNAHHALDDARATAMVLSRLQAMA